jgi:hypothetical protein
MLSMNAQCFMCLGAETFETKGTAECKVHDEKAMEKQ